MAESDFSTTSASVVQDDGYQRIELNKTVWELPKRYQMLSYVGSGAFGQVCSALDKEKNINIAIKKLVRPFQSEIHAKRTFREIKILKHMNHENIIGLLDLFTPAASFEKFTSVYLVTHLLGVDLNSVVKQQNPTEKQIQFFIYQILRGLKYVHSAGIIHRDLKPSNVAVNDDLGLKILDFGLARQTDTSMTGYVATRWYRAPEIMLNWMHYNQTVDIWSVGCIMGELLIGKPLFPGEDHIDQLHKIMQLVGTPGPEFLSKITSENARQYVADLPSNPKQDFGQIFVGVDKKVLDLLERMLDLDPDRRITASDALAHGYFDFYHDETDEPDGEKFDDSFETTENTTGDWRAAIWREIKDFEPRQEQL